MVASPYFTRKRQGILSSFLSESVESDNHVYEYDIGSLPSMLSQASVHCTPDLVRHSSLSADSGGKASVNLMKDKDDCEARQVEPSDGFHTPETVILSGSDGEINDVKPDNTYVLTIKEYVSPSNSMKMRLRSKGKRKNTKNDVRQNRVPSEREDVSVRTPVLSRKNAQKPFSDSKSDNCNTSHSFDISPFIKSARYGQQDQRFRLFWLPNSEVSSLMRVPSIAQMSSSRKELTENLYIVFTPGGIDIIQDASHIAGVEHQPLQTPFVILYSYNFRSMYFKVVERVIGSCDSITFDENGDSATVTSDKSAHRGSHPRNKSEDNNENRGYEFYRSYLYGVDDGATTRRITVALRNVKETVLDMRDASVEDKANGRIRSVSGYSNQQGDFQLLNSKGGNVRSRSSSTNKRRSFDISSSRSNDSMEFDGGVSTRGSQRQRADIRRPTKGYWIYESTDYHDGSEYETVSGLPAVLLGEIKRLIGLEDVTRLLQCNLAMVHHRIESMIKRNFQLYDRDDNCITDDVKHDMEVIKNNSPDSKAVYRVKDRVISVGDLVIVRFPSLYRGHSEDDTIKIYGKDVLTQCFMTLESFTSDAPEDLTMALAQHCPNIYWNLVLMGNIEEALSQIAPKMCANARKRRRRVTYEPVPTPTKPQRAPAKSSATPVFDNNFLIMQNLFEHDARNKIERLKRVGNQKRDFNGKITRNSISKYLDNEALIATVMDPDGFLLKSMESLTAQQKTVVYQTCLRRGLYAPIKLDYVAGKGRAVFAAYDIGKDEFIVEYKGQIITEKVAKLRNQKYDQSRSYKGSFVFYFKVKTKRYCIDATEEDIMFGPARLINHSRKNPNIVPKALELDGCPRLFFVAKRNIKSGEELLIDYGERDPSVIKDNPWLLD